MRPKERLLESARIAMTVDDEPNSDFIDFIAGYEARGGLYHYFRTVESLLRVAEPDRKTTNPPRILPKSDEFDLATVVPRTIQRYPVHVETGNTVRQLVVWQKVNGGMRLVTLERPVPKVSFLSGVLLYAGEGTRSVASGRVEISSSNPGIIRLFMRFLDDIGVPKGRLKARIQVHDPSEESKATRMWIEKVRLGREQFTKPLVSAPSVRIRRETYTLQVSYANTMLLMLLRDWTTNLERCIGMVGNA
jgi:hypothetical protein